MEALDLDTVTIFTVVRVIKNLISKTLPFVAAAALLYPATRKLADSDWREELNTTYQLGDSSFGAGFFVLVGLIELALAGLILWRRTRVPAGLAMAGFFVGALVFNLGLRVDQKLLPDDRPGLGALIALDISHLLIGLAVAALWWNRLDADTAMTTTVYTDSAGQALQGHDPVAYFTVGAPTKGNSNISREWNGATWLFATAENRELFDADPDKYAPAFGGHCAVAKVMGSDLKGSPKRWRIKDGRLYINKNLLASSMFGPLAGRIQELDVRS